MLAVAMNGGALPEEELSDVHERADDQSAHRANGSDEGAYSITCPRCYARDPRCERCQGSGEEAVSLREIHAVSRRRDIMEALRAYSAFRQHGVMPALGALNDQAAAFGEVVSLIDWQLAEDRKREQRDSEVQQRMAMIKERAGATN